MTSRPLFTLLALVAVSFFAIDFADAQKGGRGGGGGKGGGKGGKGGKGGGRFDPVRDLLKPSFVRATPAGSGQATSDGGAASHFESFVEIKEAAKKGHVSLLYVYDNSDADKLRKFEEQMLSYKSEALVSAFKVFKLVKLDAAEDPKAKELYENTLPVFIAFDNKGKLVAEASLKGYKPNTKSVMSILAKASKGHAKMSLTTFVKNYRSFINKYDQLLRDEKTSADKIARLESDESPRGKAKLKKAQKEAETLAKTRKKLFDAEKKLRVEMKAPIAENEKDGVAVGS